MQYSNPASPKISRKLWLFIFILSGIILTTMMTSNMSSLKRQATLIAQREAELEVEKKAVEDIRRKIEFTQSDAYIEQAAREHLNLAYPGEIWFVDRNSIKD